MKIILLKNIPKLGSKFDIKQVSIGYAKNFLIPNKMAIIATENSISHIKKLRAHEGKINTVTENNFKKLTEQFKNSKIILEAKTNKEGKLFASINKEDIRTALKEQKKIELDENIKISIDEPLKNIGEHKINLILSNKKITLGVIIKADLNHE